MLSPLRCLAVLALLCAVAAAGGSDARWYEQKLDHFNPEDGRTFNQKWFMDDTYWVPGGVS